MNDRRKFDPESAGLWQGCDGDYYTAAGKCRRCGKGRAEHHPAGLPPAVPERTAEPALDAQSRLQIAVPRIDGACRVVITRGYGSAGPLDYDNLVGGAKALRDQIAEKILHRKSDAENTGILWEYRQEPGHGCKVEIFQTEKKKKEVKR